MSRAKPAAERRELDAYQTPAPLAREIVRTLARRLKLTCPEVIEPSAGTGTFVQAAREEWPGAHVTAIDIDPECHGALVRAGADMVLVGDWPETSRSLALEQDETRPPRRIILGNPPFRQAEEHIEAGLELLLPGEHLAFLLRVNFLGSAARVPFWRKGGLLWLSTIAPRPSFTGGGTDGTEYALFTWKKGYRGAPRIVRPIVWRAERRRAA